MVSRWGHFFVLSQFSHSVMSNSLWPHKSQHARPPCPSPIPGVHSNSCPLSRWCHPAISSCVVPFSSCPNHALPILPESLPHKSFSTVLCPAQQIEICWLYSHDSLWAGTHRRFEGGKQGIFPCLLLYFSHLLLITPQSHFLPDWSFFPSSTSH